MTVNTGVKTCGCWSPQGWTEVSAFTCLARASSWSSCCGHSTASCSPSQSLSNKFRKHSCPTQISNWGQNSSSYKSTSNRLCSLIKGSSTSECGHCCTMSVFMCLEKATVGQVLKSSRIQMTSMFTWPTTQFKSLPKPTVNTKMPTYYL